MTLILATIWLATFLLASFIHILRLKMELKHYKEISKIDADYIKGLENILKESIEQIKAKGYSK